MSELLGSILEQVRLTTLVDIGITALLIYWLFSLIRGTRAVRLVIGVSVLIVVYVLAVAFGLELLTRILQGGAVVGLFALVVIFQPEIRRALERIGRVGSLGWLLLAGRFAGRRTTSPTRSPGPPPTCRAEGHGALIVLERETGLEEVAESGVMIHGDVSADLIRTIFAPRTALHDGAVIIRGETILAAGALLPLAETTVHVRALRDPPPGRPRHRRADRRGRRRRLRGERPDQPRRALAHRAQPQRGASSRGRSAHLLDPNRGRRRGAFGWRAGAGASTDHSAARAPR